MSATLFNPADPRTWSQTLVADEVAAIYRRKVGGLKKCCQRRLFSPAPFKRNPYLWRKSDLLRDIKPAREQVTA